MNCRKAVCRALGSFIAASAMIQAAAADESAPRGTLTCTSMPSEARAAAETVLNCSFAGASGTQFQYTGALLQKGKATAPAGKRVFVWSVLAETEVSSGTVLAGRYVGKTGEDSSGILFQRANASVVLKPPARTSQLGENSAISVLEISLDPVRT